MVQDAFISMKMNQLFYANKQVMKSQNVNNIEDIQKIEKLVQKCIEFGFKPDLESRMLNKIYNHNNKMNYKIIYNFKIKFKTNNNYNNKNNKVIFNKINKKMKLFKRIMSK